MIRVRKATRAPSGPIARGARDARREHFANLEAFDVQRLKGSRRYPNRTALNTRREVGLRVVRRYEFESMFSTAEPAAEVLTREGDRRVRAERNDGPRKVPRKTVVAVDDADVVRSLVCLVHVPERIHRGDTHVERISVRHPRWHSVRHHHPSRVHERRDGACTRTVDRVRTEDQRRSDHLVHTAEVRALVVSFVDLLLRRPRTTHEQDLERRCRRQVLHRERRHAVDQTLRVLPREFHHRR